MPGQEYIYIQSSLTLKEEARNFADMLGLEMRSGAGTTADPTEIELTGAPLPEQRRTLGAERFATI